MLHIQSFVIQFAQSLQPQLCAIKAQDPKLADQLRRALMSVALNLGEGYGASGGSKRRAYRIAHAEASELSMGLLMAEALCYCSLSDEQRDGLGRILATLCKLARPCR